MKNQRGLMINTSSRRGNVQGWSLLIPALLWTLVFFALPLAIMLLYSFWQRVGNKTVREFTLQNYGAFFSKASLTQALWNSLEVTLLVTVISILLAYPMAYILAYVVPQRWQRLALLLAILPFWTSYIVRSYSWLLVLSENGVVSKFLQNIGILSEPTSFVNSRTGTVIGFVHFFVMLLALTIYANLVQISPSYRKAAADLGASSWQTFWNVTFPLSVPGVMVGAFLTFVLCIGDYITPQILGGSKELLLPQAIMLQVGRSTNFPMASALSMILMIVITVAFVAFSRWLRLERV
jgi:spermidine/putrescine transport system permease protein